MPEPMDAATVAFVVTTADQVGGAETMRGTETIDGCSSKVFSGGTKDAEKSRAREYKPAGTEKEIGVSDDDETEVRETARTSGNEISGSKMSENEILGIEI